MAYYRIEPFGPLRWAQLAATVVVACLAPWRKKGASALKPADVFPELGDGSKAGLPTPAGLRAKLLAIFGGLAKQMASRGGLK